MSQAVEDALPQYICRECEKTYSTAGHLRRHEVTHSGYKSAHCPFCSRLFVKADVARRHAVSCAKRQRADTPPQAKRGRKTRACDRCAVKKMACDAASPCSRCSSLGVPCSYLRADHRSGGRDVECNSIPFLLNFVDNSFESATAAIAAAEPCEDHVGEPDRGDWHLFSNGWSECGLLFDISDGVDYWGYSSLDPLPLGDDASSHLSIRLDEVIRQLATVQQRTCASDSSQPHFDYNLARSVFTAPNLVSFSRGYFDRYYPQMPLIHRPTFALETASAPLLLAIFAAGAATLRPADGPLAARGFVGLIEEFIFSQDPFMRYLGRQDSHTAAEQVPGEIEVLQAALIISTLQSSVHDITTRRRVRVERHPLLVAVVRASGALAQRRERGRCSWEEFVAEEVRIRLAVFTIAHDGHLCLFFNNPSQICVAEMIGDVPCRENLFEAETAHEFDRLSAAEWPCKSLTMCQFITTLSRAGRGVAQNFPTQISVIQLQSVIWALSGAVFTARISLGESAQLNAVFRATESWKLLWIQELEEAKARGMPLTGSRKHAAEICWLLQAIIKVAQTGDYESSYMRTFAGDSLIPLDEFIRKYKEL